MLAAAGGNSPFLADLAVREAASLAKMVRAGPDAVVDRRAAPGRRLPGSPPPAPSPGRHAAGR